MHSNSFSLKQVFGNTLWYGIVPKLPAILNVFLMPFITPYLTPDDYGTWGKISAFSEIGIAFCAMGLNVHLTNSFYEYKSKYNVVWGRISMLIHLFSLTISIILFVVILFILKEAPLIERIVVAVLGVFSTLFYTNQLLASHLYPLRCQPKPLVLRNLIASLLGVIALFISVVFFKMGYIGFVINVAVSSLFSYILFIYPIWMVEKIKPILTKNRNRLKNWIIIALPIVPHSLGFSLLTSATRISLVLLGVSDYNLGLFTNGGIMGNYVVLLTSALASSLVPRIQEYYRAKQLSSFRNLFYFSQTITLSAIFIISIWMKDIYGILVNNEELRAAWSIAMVVCFANVIYPFYHFTSSIISIEKRTTYLLWLVFVPGVTCVIANVVLVPIFGYKAAIYTTLVSYLTQFIMPFIVPYIKEITKSWLGSLNKIFILVLIVISLIFLSELVVKFDYIAKIIISTIVMLLTFSILITLKNKLKI